MKRRWLALAVVLGALAGVAGPPAAADDAFRCALEESRGVPEPDAGTAARVVCEHLGQASGRRGAFGVTLATLGKVVILTVRREEPAASVTVELRGLEEIPSASPRIADALVHGLAFSQTQRVDNLLEAETRSARAKKGSVKFTAGVADVESIGHGARAAGFSLGILYATPRFALPAEMRFAWDDSASGEPSLDLFSFSVGGRGYLSKRDVSPYLGGGVGILRLQAGEGLYPYEGAPGGSYFYGERFGFAPYVEAGVEILRLHRGRIGLQVRADLPLWSLDSPAMEVYVPWDGRGPYPDTATTYPAESRYVVPVSIGVTVAF
jgi:hypothetical protein